VAALHAVHACTVVGQVLQQALLACAAPARVGLSASAANCRPRTRCTRTLQWRIAVRGNEPARIHQTVENASASQSQAWPGGPGLVITSTEMVLAVPRRWQQRVKCTNSHHASISRRLNYCTIDGGRGGSMAHGSSACRAALLLRFGGRRSLRCALAGWRRRCRRQLGPATPSELVSMLPLMPWTNVAYDSSG
jgi:hypothetical protein